LFSFLNIAFLGALPLAAVPVVIHLLNRRQHDLVRWGAMRFLVEAATRRRRLWRTNDLLLMILRALAVLLLVFALAGPLARSSLFGTAGSRDVILILDGSMSTARRLDGGTVFDEQVRQAESLISRLNETDSIRLMLAAATPEWLTPAAVSADDRSKTHLLRHLRELAPTLAGADMLHCVREAVEAEPADAQAVRIITVITDGRAHGWRAGTAELWRALKERVDGMPAAPTLSIVDVSDCRPSGSNLSVESLTTSRPIVGTGESVVFTAGVRNRGGNGTPAGAMTWSRGDESLGVTTLAALDPGEATTVRVEHSFDSPGVHQVNCRLNSGDDLDMDNEGRHIVEVVERVPILVVSGPPRADPLNTQTGYLMAALGYASVASQDEWHSIFEPKVVDAQGFAHEDPAMYGCVILANVPGLTPGAIERLRDYVEAGGGLWIVLGDGTDPDRFNKTLHAVDAGLSPLSLDEPVGDPNDREHFAVIHPPTEYHRATALLADTERLDLDRARVYRRHCFSEEVGLKGVSVLLRTGRGAPLVIECKLGKGRVIVQAIPLAVDWSNLPTCQAFVVMVHEWLWYLGEPLATKWNLNVGERFSLSLSGASVPDAGVVTTPGGEEVEIAAEDFDERRVFSYSGTLRPGAYRLVLTGRNGREKAFPFVVERDPEESNLAPLSDAERETLTLAGGLQFVSDALTRGVARKGPAGAEPLWPVILCALLLLMVAELLLGRHLNRRRLARPRALEMDTDLA